MSVSGMSRVRRSRWCSKSDRFPLIGLLGLGLVQLQLVVFCHKVEDGLVTVGPHMHSKNLVISFKDDIYFLKKTFIYYDISLFTGYPCTCYECCLIYCFDYCKCWFIILEATASANVFKCVGKNEAPPFTIATHYCWGSLSTMGSRFHRINTPSFFCTTRVDPLSHRLLHKVDRGHTL